MPQMLSADGALSSYENLLIFATLYDLPRTERESRVRDALALPRHLGTTPEVSQGLIFQQKQIARAVELGLGSRASTQMVWSRNPGLSYPSAASSFST